MDNLNSSYLISVSLDRTVTKRDEYPFNLPAIRGFTDLRFHPRVTFIVGENGSGKSTIVEGLAIALGLNAEGGSFNLSFATHDTHSSLHEYLRIVRGTRRPKDGFFLRAESFYNVATMVDQINNNVGYSSQHANNDSKPLHGQSHGEAFLSLVRHRLQGGLYMMDEPEAALSTTGQMEFLALIHELVGKGAQLIIATHSPIIVSYPDALIYEVDGESLQEVTYEQTKQYQLMRYFLNNYKSMLRDIIGKSE
jgi:predicted ATPase